MRKENHKKETIYFFLQELINAKNKDVSFTHVLDSTIQFFTRLPFLTGFFGTERMKILKTLGIKETYHKFFDSMYQEGYDICSALIRNVLITPEVVFEQEVANMVEGRYKYNNKEDNFILITETEELQKINIKSLAYL